MKSGLWIVVLVVAIFMGFLMGYSLPPMIEVGMIGAEQDEAIGIRTDVNEDMEEYYKQLSQDDE